MSGAQAHLLVNHLSVFGVAFGLSLLAAGIAFKKEELNKAALWAFVLAGLAALPAFYTGEPAEEIVENLPGVSEAFIHAHESSAKWALGGAMILAALAAFALARGRAERVFRGEILAAVAIAALATLGVMARTAHLGGLIRHTELRSGVVAMATGEDGGHED